MLHRVSRLRTMKAVLFDLDGVLTPTADIHRLAWSELFTDFLRKQGVAPYCEADYFAYIDGKPRFEGVASLLQSRGIALPRGVQSDSEVEQTICGLGNRKNAEFSRLLKQRGVQPYLGSVEFLDALETSGVAVAVVSSSRNARPVLEAAGLLDRFPLVVDGLVSEQFGLPGKPAPDTYRFAATQLGYLPAQTVVVEDAESGVASGRAGEFGLVVGVNRGAGSESLFVNGADVVVNDLKELLELI